MATVVWMQVKLPSLLLFCSFLWSCHATRHTLFGRPRGGLLGAPKVPVDAMLPGEQWLTQNLDHFNPADTRTWQQRYFVNESFYHGGGPVFLMIGGEGTAQASWMVTGQWIKYAKVYNAFCVQLEHRYYGKSHPTRDLKTENLAYLSSEQALADLATFHQYVTQKYQLEGARWITFGGSYPGGLSAWARFKYPHLFHAAVSTSAPLQAQLNFKEYLGVVRDSLMMKGNLCVNSIKNATRAVEKIVATKGAGKTLRQYFRLCADLDTENSNDVSNFFSVLAGNFENVVQYNKDNREFEGAVGTNITIDTLCGIMTDSSLGEPIQRYAAVNSLMLDTYKQTCQEVRYDRMISDLQEIDWASTMAEGGRQWTYQVCTEFGYFQTSDIINQPFGHHFPIDFWVPQCAQIFGSQFTQSVLEQGISRTNMIYGGYKLNVTRTVFVNGAVDPWHALGFITDVSPEAPAIFIKGTAHCANMYPDSPDDPPQLVQARNLIQKLIGKWLQA